VAISEEKVVLAGPGVEEEWEKADLPENLSDEGLAIVVVILFEEEES
jgi:hypothetical protein